MTTQNKYKVATLKTYSNHGPTGTCPGIYKKIPYDMASTKTTADFKPKKSKAPSIMKDGGKGR